MDAEGPDAVFPIPNGKILKENRVGKHLLNYDSMLVFAHFKGHPMGGYGGALKQLAIGCASRAGKALIHSAGKTDDRFETWQQHASSVVFPEAMADAASSIVEHFKGNVAFINVMKNLSVDCDCCEVAEDPCMRDIGMLASLDPVAIDQACMDLIVHSDDPGPRSFPRARQQPQRHPHDRGPPRTSASAPVITSASTCNPALLKKPARGPAPNRKGGCPMPKGSEEWTSRRKAEILRACAALYETKDFRDITLKDIGGKTSMTRTSIYNYFRTKQEIFLALLQNEYEAWIADLQAIRRENEAMTAESFASALARSLEKRRLFLKILAMNHYDLEDSSRPENLVAFKRGLRRLDAGRRRVLREVFPAHDGRRPAGFSLCVFPVPIWRLPLHDGQRQAAPGDGGGARKLRVPLDL